MRSIKLTAAATSTMPRMVLVMITAIYGLVGIFGRDPWKGDDAIGFGVMWTLAHGQWQDWLLPHLQGREDIFAGPLPYWMGATLIKLIMKKVPFSSWTTVSYMGYIHMAYP